MTLSQHKGSWYLVFTGWLPVLFLPLLFWVLITLIGSGPDMMTCCQAKACSKWPASPSPPCSWEQSSDPVGPQIKLTCLTHIPLKKTMIHFVVPFCFFKCHCIFPQFDFITFNWRSHTNILCFCSSSYEVYLYLFLFFCFTALVYHCLSLCLMLTLLQHLCHT